MSRRGAPPVVRYVPVEQVAGQAHVMVDGAPRPGTALTLSHWPRTPTPPELWDDLSAGICLRARGRVDLWPTGVEVATVDHYDADGVIALALLCVEGLADAHAPLLRGAARVGDFGVVSDRRAALVAFAVDGVVDPSPPAGARVGRGAGAVRAALELMADLAEEPDRYQRLWSAEAAAYDTACRAVAEGWARVEELPEHDLAVVHIDAAHPDAAGATWAGAPLHRAAVHSATPRLRMLTVAGRRVELRYRYESWVRLATTRPRRRVDLGALAVELSGHEDHGARWTFDGAGAITGALHTVDGAPSSIEPSVILDRVCGALAALDEGPPAWDPYATAGALRWASPPVGRAGSGAGGADRRSGQGEVPDREPP